MNSSSNALLIDAFAHAERQCARVALDSDIDADAVRDLTKTLAGMRTDSALGNPPTAAAVGALVRDAATWTGDGHVGLLAALGAIVRALPRRD
ncbi:MAG TPA: hypothetical protein VFG84_11315 [Gemmatimonadaceae bacterium]|nr:hypothetical protein [Gemmatimonadaceae bacterium]